MEQGKVGVELRCEDCKEVFYDYRCKDCDGCMRAMTNPQDNTAIEKMGGER